MPVGVTGRRAVTHHDLVRVAWQGQRMKTGRAMGNMLGQLSEDAASEILIYNLFL